MTTKLPNPHYSPDICVMLTLLNFQATMNGLSDQMLGLAVKLEAPELEKQSNLIILEDSQNKSELKKIEDTILRLLDAAEGNILDDDHLISTLSASKVTSAKIEDKVKVSERVKKHIDIKRKVYEPVAYRAATLFFCISALANVDPMYQWSMQFYTSLFTNSVKKTPKPTLPPSMAQMKPAKKEVERQKLRILALMNVLTKNLYSNICRTLKN